MDSILDTVKKVIGGIDADYTQFDEDIIVNINSSLMTLRQLGVKIPAGFLVTGSSETWDDLEGAYPELESLQLYMSLKVKVVFDPPSSSFVLEALKEQIKELEWRINVEADTT